VQYVPSACCLINDPPCPFLNSFGFSIISVNYKNCFKTSRWNSMYMYEHQAAGWRSETNCIIYREIFFLFFYQILTLGPNSIHEVELYLPTGKCFFVGILVDKWNHIFIQIKLTLASVRVDHVITVESIRLIKLDPPATEDEFGGLLLFRWLALPPVLTETTKRRQESSETDDGEC
jgi:hypothetical protein